MGLEESLLVNPLHEFLRCHICHQVVELPVFGLVAGICCHTFCKQCAEETLCGQDSSCPVCRQSMKASQLDPNHGVQHLVDEVLVRCSNHADGCDWVGPQVKRRKHEATCSTGTVESKAAPWRTKKAKQAAVVPGEQPQTGVDNLISTFHEQMKQRDQKMNEVQDYLSRARAMASHSAPDAATAASPAPQPSEPRPEAPESTPLAGRAAPPPPPPPAAAVPPPPPPSAAIPTPLAPGVRPPAAPPRVVVPPRPVAEMPPPAKPRPLRPMPPKHPPPQEFLQQAQPPSGA
mmetsp:Transcript_458/g.1513  ORF Transcript_458/g.1513 Transcript_458/m.1513 type:complete len:289 (+) Transcript_458:93-959(+)